MVSAEQGDNLDTPTFVPGDTPDGRHMPAHKWLEAGATGSYGTVVEPCHFLQKSPNPDWIRAGYLYCERLARPFARLAPLTQPPSPQAATQTGAGLNPCVQSWPPFVHN